MNEGRSEFDPKKDLSSVVLDSFIDFPTETKT